MATTDLPLPFKYKQNTAISDTSNGQYSNLNLNQKHQNSSFAFSESTKAIATEKTKSLNYDVLHHDNENEAKKDYNLWNKKSTKDLSSNSVKTDYDFKMDDGIKNGKNSSTENNSTLSLHIEAYEDSNEVNLFDDGKECAKKNDLIKKQENSRQNFVDFTAAVIQYPFEFPRQQESGEEIPPEIAQFKASQRLLNPNQIDQQSLPQQGPAEATQQASFPLDQQQQMPHQGHTEATHQLSNQISQLTLQQPLPQGADGSLNKKLTKPEMLKRCGVTLTDEKFKNLKYFDMSDDDDLYEKFGIPPIGTVIDEYELVKKLGVGGFGAVCMAKKDNLYFAIKFMRTDEYVDADAEYNLLSENLMAPNHQDLLTACYLGTCQSTKDLSNDENDGKCRTLRFMVMKLAGVNLEYFECLPHRHNLPKSAKISTMLNALKALEAFHQTNHVHRDIKPENFAVDINDDDHLILIDVGLAMKSPTGHSSRMGYGTAAYASRGSLQQQSAYLRDDAESWFIMLLEVIIGGSPPWHYSATREEALKVQNEFFDAGYKKILDKYSVRILKHISQLKELEPPNYSFIKSCLQELIDTKNGKEEICYKYVETQFGTNVSNGKYTFGQRECTIEKTALKCLANDGCPLQIYVPTKEFETAKEGEEATLIDVKGDHLHQTKKWLMDCIGWVLFLFSINIIVLKLCNYFV